MCVGPVKAKRTNGRTLTWNDTALYLCLGFIDKPSDRFCYILAWHVTTDSHSGQEKRHITTF